MNTTRRALLRNSALMAPLVALGACATTTTTTTVNGKTTTVTKKVPVTLAGAQAEAEAILTVLKAEVGVLGAALSAAGQANLTKAMTAATSAVNAFTGITANATIPQYVSAVVAAVTTVVGMLALPPGTMIAITAGLALLNGLVAGMSSVTVTVPTSSTTTAAVSLTSKGVHAPIAIPLS